MKNFFKLREAVTSADKKPENYVDPRTGKLKVRMVPTMREQAEQVTVGDYTTKHFDICPSAVKLYSNISGKTEMTHLIVETMMLQDLLFRLEKQLIAQGSADEEDVEKAESFAEMIMDNAEQMDLYDEHSYVEDVHVAKIKQLAGEDEEEEEEEDEDEDEDEMNEKTLTPAELKKREEIAKAIERENPNMPMAKKMAIATATAKKVAEAKVVRGGYRDSQGKWHPSQTRDDILRQRAAKKAEIHGKMKGAMKKEEVDEGFKEKIKGVIRREKEKKYPLIQNRRDVAMVKAADAYAAGDHKKGDRYMKWRDDNMKKEEVELDEVSSELAQSTYKKRMDQSSAALKRDDYAGMRKAEKKAGATHLRMIKKILKR